MKTLALTLVCVVASGCALRPRYREFVPAVGNEAQARLVLQDAATHAPLPGATIEVGEGSKRVKVTTGADGAFDLPVSQGLVDADPMVVVTLPAGVTAYEIVPGKPGAAPVAEGPGLPQRCGALFDRITPTLLQVWSRSAPPARLQQMQEKLPALRTGFVEGCQGLPEEELACAESEDNPDPLSCHGVEWVLNERGAVWAKANLTPPTAEEEAARVGAPWPADAFQAVIDACAATLPPTAPPQRCHCLADVLQAKLSLAQYRAWQAARAAGEPVEPSVQLIVDGAQSLCEQASE